MHDETADDTWPREDVAGRAARPGVLVALSAGAVLALPLPLSNGTLLLGREPGAGVLLPDERLSRRHAEITRAASGWVVRDLGSRNGTFVDGERVEGVASFAKPRVIRVADTLVVPFDDLSGIEPATDDGGPVVGPRLRRALAAVAQAGAMSHTLVIQGESGTGKELAARAFHAAGPRARGPFVAVNCAAIPQGLAERLLFGTKRGAYTGASNDATGHLQAAHGGVLFLDEVGDLDPQVQAKLLRVLETHEVLPLGASVGTPVDVRVCVATHRDLRAAVVEGRFRSDLYYRLAPPEVTMPALRERTDEIPRHVASEIAATAPGLLAHARFVEACMLRAWPGNVRELRKEVRHAASRAQADGCDRVRVEHLSSTAGRALSASGPASQRAVPPASAPAADPRGARRRSYVRWSLQITREQVERALAEHGGNVTMAARSLGMQRSQLYREMQRWAMTTVRESEG